MIRFNKNRVAKFIISSSVVFVLAAFPLANNVFGAVRAYAGGSNVNLRVSPDISSEIVGSVRDRQELTIVEKAGDFMKLSTDNGNAYISSEFVIVYNDDGVVNGDDVNVRSMDGSIIGKLSKGNEVVVNGIANEMLRFSYNGSNSFIHKDYVDLNYIDYLVEVEGPNSTAAQSYAVVISKSALNLRSLPDIDSQIITKLQPGEILDVLEVSGEWIKVKNAGEKTGFVSSEFISVKTGPKPEKVAPSSKGGEVIEYAKQFLGTPYVYGGTNLTKGVDCSGFVYSVYRNFGMTLNRTSSSMPSNGVKINKSELVAGDLVFFSNGGAKNIQHVGIYCGDGTFIHSASGRARRVIVSSMNEAYYLKNYITAARVLK